MTIQQYLKEKAACSDAYKWAQGKSWQQIYSTCERGDWLCWLYKRSPGYDLRKLTLVKAYQAKQVEHLMKDERSKKAIEVAIQFGLGKASRKQLDAAAYASDAASAAAYAYAADAASAAAYAAAADAASYAAYAAADAADAASYAAAAARKASLKKSADIFRKHISIDDFKFNFQ